MKTASTQLKAHLASDCTTLATLFLLTRTDGVVIALTDCDHDLTFTAPEGSQSGIPILYHSEDGMTRTASSFNSDMSPDNMEATAFLDSDLIDERDVRGKLYDGCDVEIRIVNYADLTQGALRLHKAVFGKITTANGLFTVECRGLMSNLGFVIGDTYGPTCRAELGDAKCGIDMSLWRQTGTVASVVDSLSIVPTSGLKMKGSATPTTDAPAGWFVDGILTYTSGVNSGLTSQIGAWDGTTLIFTLPMFGAPSPGDTFTIEPGCNHSAQAASGDCQNKFKNIINFRGEPDIPGQDQVLAYQIPPG